MKRIELFYFMFCKASASQGLALLNTMFIGDKFLMMKYSERFLK